MNLQLGGVGAWGNHLLHLVGEQNNTKTYYKSMDVMITHQNMKQSKQVRYIINKLQENHP